MRAIKTHKADDIFMCSVVISCFETFKRLGGVGGGRVCAHDDNRAYVEGLADVFLILSVTKESTESL